MSYAFDTLSRAWEVLKQQLPEATRDGEVAMRFGFMLEEIHDANHRLRDAVNHDASVTTFARRLEAAMTKAAHSTPPPAPTAAEQAQPVAIYQIRLVFPLETPYAWHDCTEEAYYVNPTSNRRIVYATPVPEQAQPAGVTERLHAFLAAAADADLTLSNIDAADLYIALFPEQYAARAQEGEKP